jgi:hypothetical protein
METHHAITLGAAHFGFKMKGSDCLALLYETEGWYLDGVAAARAEIPSTAGSFLDPYLSHDAFVLGGLVPRSY